MSFLVFAGLTVAALVAFPAQDLPVLIEHDLAVIDLALVLLAAGTAGALAGSARRGQATRRWVLTPTVVGAVLTLGAVLAYKAIGGVGWPDWWQRPSARSWWPRPAWRAWRPVGSQPACPKHWGRW